MVDGRQFRQPGPDAVGELLDRLGGDVGPVGQIETGTAQHGAGIAVLEAGQQLFELSAIDVDVGCGVTEFGGSRGGRLRRLRLGTHRDARPRRVRRV